MKELIMDSYAKINLALDILYKRDDGYHEIKSIMQSIDLKDRLIFKEIDKGIVIESNNLDLPIDSTNLVCRAYEKLAEITGGSSKGIKVFIEKKIPIAAGLAGGSTNGATTLLALNKLWGLNLTEEELMEIGKGLGADVPFCIMGGTALAQGIGDKLNRIKPFSGKHILLCNPGIRISTEYAYRKVQILKERIDIEGMISSIEADNQRELAEKMANSMEASMIGEHPIIGRIKNIMLENGALGALMSGSGSTVFGIYDDMDKMKFTHKKLLDIADKVFISKTI